MKIIATIMNGFYYSSTWMSWMQWIKEISVKATLNGGPIWIWKNSQ